MEDQEITVVPVEHPVESKDENLEPFSAPEVTLMMQDFVKNLIDSKRPLTFEVMINVFMNAYIAVLFQFVKPEMVLSTMQEHFEKIMQQLPKPQAPVAQPVEQKSDEKIIILPNE